MSDFSCLLFRNIDIETGEWISTGSRIDVPRGKTLSQSVGISAQDGAVYGGDILFYDGFFYQAFWNRVYLKWDFAALDDQPGMELAYIDIDEENVMRSIIAGNRYQPIFKDFDYHKARAYVREEFGL